MSGKFWSRCYDAVMIVLSPITFILLLILMAIAVVIGAISYVLEKRRFRKQLGSRFHRPPQLDPLTGTIIVDQTAWIKGEQRVWWTHDDVLTLCPVPKQTETEKKENWDRLDEGKYTWPAFDRWVFEHYLDPVKGSAILLETSSPWQKRESFEKRFPHATIVETFSGGQELDEELWSRRKRRKWIGRSSGTPKQVERDCSEH